METTVKIFLLIFLFALALLAFQFYAENPIGGEPGISFDFGGKRITLMFQ